MQDADLAIILFCLTLAIGAGYEAVKAWNAKERWLLAFFCLAGLLFFLSGVLWLPLKGLWPSLTAWITSVATNPETWFGLAAIIYVIFVVRRAQRPIVSEESLRKQFSRGISPDIGRLERQMESLKLSLSPLEQQGQDLTSKIGEIERMVESMALRVEEFKQFQSSLSADIARLNQLGVAQHQVSESFRGQLVELQNAVKAFDERLSTHQRVVANGTYLLIRALRARDAMREILIPNDKIAISLGKRLVEAKAADYPDPASWLSDYQQWNEAVRAIDRLMMEWTRSTSYEPVSLFDLEGRHFQHSPMPPENIRADDTIIPFKTVWHVQSSYANQRDSAFSFFNERIAYPG